MKQNIVFALIALAIVRVMFRQGTRDRLATEAQERRVQELKQSMRKDYSCI